MGYISAANSVDPSIFIQIFVVDSEHMCNVTECIRVTEGQFKVIQGR